MSQYITGNQEQSAHSIEAELGHYARTLWDIQKTRVMMSNRLSALIRDEFPESSQQPIKSTLLDLEKTERFINGTLERVAKHHFMADWIVAQRGIGLAGFARIIGITGSLDNFITVSKLWRYMGMAVDGGMAPKRVRGEKLHFSPQGRVVCHQIADSMVKLGGHYRELYDKKRAEYLARPRSGGSNCPFGQEHSGDEKQHDDATNWERKTGKKRVVQCVKTTADGESSAHVHNAAMRYMIKCFLKDMWAEWHRWVSIPGIPISVEADPSITQATIVYRAKESWPRPQTL